jgi:periplasmic protein TonB
MFDYVSTKPTQETDKPRYMTATVSAVVHVVVLFAAVGLPILYASEELPTPPDMMAFVMEAPVPPPPPPPPAPPPPVQKAQPAKPNQPALKTPQRIAQANPAAAPVEAPRAIMPESGVEAANGGARIEAGFEGGIEGGVVGGAIGGIATGAPPPPPPPPAPKPVPQGPIRVGGQIKAPLLVNRVNPAYPAVAQSAQVEGSVILEATVGKDGRVQTVRVVRGHALLEQAAITAVKQWRYEPLALNGEPVPFILTVTLNFTIPR